MASIFVSLLQNSNIAGLRTACASPTLIALSITEYHSMATLPTTSLKLDAGMKTRLQRLATARRRSAHWLMRDAIAQYVEREEARARLHKDALAAWAEYQATGRHVTADEADAWLARLAAGEDSEPPSPHD